MNKVLAILSLMSAVTCLAENSVVYFIPPMGYIASYEKILNAQTYQEDDFCRVMDALRDQLKNRGYQLLPTKLDKKLEQFAGLLASDLSERQMKKIKKYPKDKLILIKMDQSDKAAARYFGKKVTLENGFADNVMNHLALPKLEQVSADADDSEEVSEADVVAPLILSIIMGPASIKPGQSAILNVVTDGGVEPLTFRWSDGQEGENLNSILVSPTHDTEYRVTVRDSANPPVEIASLPLLLKIGSEQKEEVVNREEAAAREKIEVRESAQDPAASIEGKREYKSNEVIQLKAFPDGARYSWTGPQGFASTMQKVSRRASQGTSGTYTVKIEKGGETHMVKASVKVVEQDASLAQVKPAVNVPAQTSQVHAHEAPQAADGEVSELLVVRTRNFVKKDSFINFTVVVQNAGKAAAKEIALTDIIPAGFELVELKGEGWNVQESRYGFTAQLGKLAAGTSKSLIVTVRSVREDKEPAYNKVVVVSRNGVERECLALLK